VRAVVTGAGGCGFRPLCQFTASRLIKIRAAVRVIPRWLPVAVSA
jgi:hypothetical protein